MRIILLGHPGSGKGTQAKLLSQRYNIPHISTGEMFRAVAKENTALGKEVEKIINSGSFVPDNVTVKVVKERLSRKDCKNGFILDGFPRSVQQAEEMYRLSGIDKVIHIHVEDSTVVKRLSARRQCRKCGTIYGLDRKPKKDLLCDKCKVALYQREDDKPDKIRKRIAIYHKETKPLIEYYKKKSLYETVDGEQGIEKVFSDICRILEAKKT